MLLVEVNESRNSLVGNQPADFMDCDICFKVHGQSFIVDFLAVVQAIILSFEVGHRLTPQP